LGYANVDLMLEEMDAVHVGEWVEYLKWKHAQMKAVSE